MTAELDWPVVASPDDLSEVEAVPLEDRDLPATTWEIVERARRRWPDRTAVTLLPSGAEWESPITWTFGELTERITRVANVFASLGVQRGEAVTLMSTNTGLLLAATLAAEAVGIAAPVNPTLAPDRVATLVHTVESRVIVAAGPELQPQIWDGACQLAAATGVRHVLALRPDDATGNGPELSGPDGVQVAYLEDLTADQPGDHLTVDPPSTGDVAAYFHTGGTTGLPKIAAHTHANEVAMAWTMGVILPLEVPSTILAGLPLFHVNALMVTGVMPLLRGHQALWTGPLGFRDEGLYANLWKIVERYRVASMSAVPTVYGVLAEVPVDADITSLQIPVVGAAPLPPSVRRAWLERTGVALCEGYGLTEATTASAFTPPGHQREGSVGLRLPYQRFRVVDLDDDGTWTDVPTGEVGVLAIAGPTVFPGFLVRDEDGTRRLDPKGTVRDGWLDTGDLARLDEDDFVYLTGRAKDLIIRGGHNIDPAEIEDAMLDHPAVTGAGAVGRPDAHAGEVPVVYVSVDGDVDVDELQRWAEERVTERAAAPKDVIVIDAIPVTAVGKPFKPALREDAAVRLLRDELAEAGVDIGEDAVSAHHEDGRLVLDVQAPSEDTASVVKHVTDPYGLAVRVRVA